MRTRILPILGTIMMLSLLIRTWALSSELNVVPTKITPDGSTEKVQIPALSASTQPPDQQCVTGEVLQAVNTKMAALKKRESEMISRESAFRAIEVRLQQQLVAVETAKASLDESLRYRTEIAKDDIVHLSAMYETMKPKQAARIFNEMDANFAAGFLRQMKGRQAGLILANMNTTKAYQISLILASKGAKYRTLSDRSP